MTKRRRAPMGSTWRILAHGKDGSTSLYSADYPKGSSNEVYNDGSTRLKRRAVFDELVICGVLHLEQLNARSWCLMVGDECMMVTVARNGKVTHGEWYR